MGDRGGGVAARQPLPHLLDDRDDLAWSAPSVEPSQPHPRPPPPSVSSQHGNFASQRPHNRSEQPPPASARPHAPTSLAASSAPPPATTGSQTAASARDTIGAAPPNPSHPQCPRGAPLSVSANIARRTVPCFLCRNLLRMRPKPPNRHFRTGVRAADAALSHQHPQRRRLH